MDPIANFLNKLNIASKTGKESFSFPASNLILAIAGALERKGFITSVGKKGKKGRAVEVVLSYASDKPRVEGVRRISRLSRRVYRASRDLRPVRSGFGTAILSTPKGVLTDSEAKASKVGGEVLFEIW